MRRNAYGQDRRDGQHDIRNSISRTREQPPTTQIKEISQSMSSYRDMELCAHLVLLFIMAVIAMQSRQIDFAPFQIWRIE